MYLNDLLARYQDTSELTFTTYWKGDAPKCRLIAIPAPALARMQRELLEYLQGSSLAMAFPSSVTGCIPQGSPLRNARQHSDGRWFYQLDFADAFGSVEASKLADVLSFVCSRLGSKQEIEDFLSQYCLVSGHGLAQGGPASPLLFNLYCQDIDFRLGELVKKKPINYTRYVDDLTFSSWSRPFSPVLRKQIRKIIRAAGFEINTSKTRVLALGSGDRAVEITGIRLLSGGRLAFGKDFLDALEAALNECLHSSGTPDSQLAGMIGHFKNLRSRAPNRQERRISAKIGRLFRPIRQPKPRIERFSPTELDSLRMKVSLAELVGEVVKLKPSGKEELKGLCPFHREKTSSFFVVPEKGFYHCFGCGAHGDAVGFVMRIHNMDYVRAVRYLQNLVATNTVP